jgi:hypothetical protein
MVNCFDIDDIPRGHPERGRPEEEGWFLPARAHDPGKVSSRTSPRSNRVSSLQIDPDPPEGQYRRTDPSGTFSDGAVLKATRLRPCPSCAPGGIAGIAEEDDRVTFGDRVPAALGTERGQEVHRPAAGEDLVGK